MASYFEKSIEILQILIDCGFEAMLAGGCVRDRLLGVLPKDYDVATTANPSQLLQIFSSKGLRVVPTGIDHGTVTVVTDSGPIEITTLRRDVETDGRRAQVVFGTSFEEDALRRDFTINAMFEDISGRVHDFFEGQRHLRENRLVFVGDPRARIKEDYLRILRFFRFCSRFNSRPERNALDAIAALKMGIEQLSSERIAHEVRLMMACSRVEESLKHMSKLGILSHIFKIYDSPGTFLTNGIDRFVSSNKAEVRIAFCLTQLIPQDWNWVAVSSHMKNLKYSKKEASLIAVLSNRIRNLPSEAADDATQMAWIDSVEDSAMGSSFQEVLAPAWEVFIDCLFPEMNSQWFGALKRLRDLEDAKGELRCSPIPIRSLDVARSLGIGGGAQLGLILRELQFAYRNGEWSSSEEGLGLARKIFADKILPKV